MDIYQQLDKFIALKDVYRDGQASLSLSSDVSLHHSGVLKPAHLYDDNVKPERNPMKVKAVWLKTLKMRVFVRKSRRVLLKGQPIVNVLDIATVEVNENHRRKGLFKNFLEYAEKVNPWDAIFIENAFNDFLRDYLEKNDWQRAITPLCYFKMNSNCVNNAVSIDDLNCDNMPDSYVIARVNQLKREMNG